MDSREYQVSAVTIAHRYQEEILLDSKLPKVRPDGLGFPFLKTYGNKRQELLVEFAKFTVKHNPTTGCQTRATDARVNLKGKKASVVEILWALFRPEECEDLCKKPSSICSTRGCFSLLHCRMMTAEEAAKRNVCRETGKCNCTDDFCILQRKILNFLTN